LITAFDHLKDRFTGIGVDLSFRQIPSTGQTVVRQLTGGGWIELRRWGGVARNKKKDNPPKQCDTNSP
jgi:hypothetical protein